MTKPDMPSLIDQLGAAALECRKLLADVRSATKDLRAAVREAHDARDELADAVRTMARDDITAAVAAEIDDLKATNKQAMAESVEKITKEFDKLLNIFMTGKRRGQAAGGIDLRQLAGGGS